MNKKVSIVIPCYNQGQYIEEAVNSALNQTYKNIEIIIVNDGSIDESHEVIQKIINEHADIIYLNEKENKGVVHARNLAIQKSTGEYILPLDADDKIAETYIEKAVKILDNDEKIGMVYCECEFFGSKSERWNLPEYDDLKILYNNMIFAAALYRKSDFKRVGGYKEYMKGGYEDYDLWLSFIEFGLRPFKIKEILFFYRQYDESSRNSYAKMNGIKLQKEIIKHHKDLYLNNDEFMKNALEAMNNIELISRLKKKKNKYRKYTYSLSFVIVSLIILFFGCFMFLGR